MPACKMRWPVLRPMLVLLTLTLCSGSCTKEIPVVRPSPPCQLPAVEPFPALSRQLTDEQIRALSVWKAHIDARMNKAELCLANRS